MPFVCTEVVVLRWAKPNCTRQIVSEFINASQASMDRLMSNEFWLCGSYRNIGYMLRVPVVLRERRKKIIRIVCGWRSSRENAACWCYGPLRNGQYITTLCSRKEYHSSIFDVFCFVFVVLAKKQKKKKNDFCVASKSNESRESATAATAKNL